MWLVERKEKHIEVNTIKYFFNAFIYNSDKKFNITKAASHGQYEGVMVVS